jgi:hypothetical protein
MMIDKDIKMKSAMVSAGDVLKSFKKNTENGFKSVGPSIAEIENKIEILKVEAAKALAIETFLDCDYQKVKVSKRVPKSRKYALGYVH